MLMMIMLMMMMMMIVTQYIPIVVGICQLWTWWYFVTSYSHHCMIIKMMECLHFVQPFCHGGNVPEGHDDNDGDIDDDDDVERYDDDDVGHDDADEDAYLILRGEWR